MAARRRRSDEGQLCQYFQAKKQISQFLSYIYVIYLKRTHFSCRIQIQTKKYGSLLKNLKKFQFFLFWVKNEDDQVSSTADFSKIFITNSKMALPGVVKRFELKSHQI